MQRLLVSHGSLRPTLKEKEKAFYNAENKCTTMDYIFIYLTGLKAEKGPSQRPRAASSAGRQHTHRTREPPIQHSLRMRSLRWPLFSPLSRPRERAATKADQETAHARHAG